MHANIANAIYRYMKRDTAMTLQEYQIYEKNPVCDNFDGVTVTIPRTVVICTDIFDEFMETNNLYPVRDTAMTLQEYQIYDAADLSNHVYETMYSVRTVLTIIPILPV